MKNVIENKDLLIFGSRNMTERKHNRGFSRWISQCALIPVLLLFSGLTSAQVTVQSTSTAEGANGASLTIPAPAGIQVGDFLFATLSIIEDTGQNDTGPAGWVELSDFNPGAGDRVGLSVYYKVAVASDTTAPSYTFQIGTNDKRVGSIIRYSGVDTASPIIAHSGTATGDTITPIAPSVSTGTVSGARVVRSMAHRWSVSATPPANHVERIDRRYTLDPNDDGWLLLSVADRDQPAAGLTGTASFSTQTWDGGAEVWVAATTVLRPITNPVIAVNKTTSTPARSQFEQASYSIVVSNSSLGTSNGDVRVTDTLPAGFTLASASFTRTGTATGPGNATSGALANTGTPTVPIFNGFTLPSGTSVTITLLADIDDAIAGGTYNNAVSVSSNSADFTTATDPGTQTDEDVVVTVVCPVDDLFNTATVSSSTDDIDPSNNTSSVCVTYTPDPRIEVVKTDSPDPVRRGENLVYTLTVTNVVDSALPATNVILDDNLLAGLTWISTQNSNGGGTCVVGNLAACNCTQPGNTGTVQCQMGNLAIGETKTVVITTRVD